MSKPWSPFVFREYDIRGLSATEISPEFAYCLGSELSSLILSKTDWANHPVLLAYDCRSDSLKLMQALSQAFLDHQLRVINIGLCPTPLLYFELKKQTLLGPKDRYSAGIMTTASHNPADYNGFKMTLFGDSFFGPAIQKLKEKMQLRQTTYHPTHLECPVTSIDEAYLQFLANSIEPKRPLKVVLDAGNGMASTLAPLIFNRLGATVVPLFCEIDGSFPNHHPDPTVPQNLASLIERVKTESADFGVAFDGDADRIGVVDDQGKIWFGDELLILFAREILNRRPGSTIISEVKSSLNFYEAVEQMGGEAIMWKTGHSLIKQKMRDTQAVLAGEMSGHVFFEDRYLGFDDAIYAACRLYELLSASEKPLSQQLLNLPKLCSTPEIRVDCSDEIKFKVVDFMKAKLSKLPGKLIDIDGLRLVTPQGWGLIRASNTQPALVMRFESKENNTLVEMKTLFESQLQSALENFSSYEKTSRKLHLH